MEKKYSNRESGPTAMFISDEIFEREISMCRKLNREKKGECQWGECESCGVIPLLYKLHKGELLEKPEKIEAVKKEVFDS